MGNPRVTDHSAIHPRHIALAVWALPMVAVHLAYAISILADAVPTCIPYLDGCTSISRAARMSDAIFLFRAAMIANAVLLLAYWHLAHLWLIALHHRTVGKASRTPQGYRVMAWLGYIGALFLILYADFLGTDERVYRFMRIYGVTIYFSFTPLAQLLLLRHLYRLRNGTCQSLIDLRVLRYQSTVLLLILAIGLISVFFSALELHSDASENIVEWNFALLMAFYFPGSYLLWRNWSLSLQYDGPLEPGSG